MTKTNVLILNVFININPSPLKLNATVFSSLVCTKERVKKKSDRDLGGEGRGALRHRYRESTYDYVGFIFPRLPLEKK